MVDVHQDFFSTPYLVTWPRSGTLVSGRLYRPLTSAPPTVETASGSSALTSSGWPTARAEDGESAGMRVSRGVADTLTAAVRNWPIATASDAHTDNLSSTQQKDGSMHSVTLPQAVTRDWPTPTGQDGANTAGPSQLERNSLPLNTAVVAWSGLLPTDAGPPAPASDSTTGSILEL